MNQNKEAVTVNILGNDYQVSCSIEEKEDLIHAARFLDTKMREIKSGGNVIGLERIAVMAALNITHELLRENSESNTDTQELERINNKLSQALGNQSVLEL